MTDKHQEILQIIDSIRLTMANGDEKAIDDAFNVLFQKDKEYFGGIYGSIDDILVCYEMLNVIADNHIRLHNTLELGVHMLEWTEEFRRFVKASNFSEEEKLPVKESFLKLMVKVRTYMEREAKGEDTLREEQNIRNSKNIRPANSICLLCKKNPADEVGSHAVPHFLIQKIMNHCGKKGRDYESLDRYTLVEGERYQYIGKNILPEERAKILNHELSQEEIEEAVDDHNPLTFDHFFCKECEKRFGVIESQYAQIINSKKSDYKWSVPYLFWLSVVWRMSVAKMGISLPRDQEEKYRKIMDSALSLDKDAICSDSRKLGHCAYTIYEVEDTKGEGIGILGIPDETVPACLIIGKQIIRFYHSLDKARKMCCKSGYPLDEINDGTKKEVIGKCSFINFWKAKRSVLDSDWWINFHNYGNGKSISQFMANSNMEKEHLDMTGDIVVFEPITPDVEGYHLTIPHSISRLRPLVEKNATLDEIITETGYTKEEIEEMLSYWFARAESELNAQD